MQPNLIYDKDGMEVHVDDSGALLILVPSDYRMELTPSEAQYKVWVRLARERRQ